MCVCVVVRALGVSMFNVWHQQTATERREREGVRIDARGTPDIHFQTQFFFFTRIFDVGQQLGQHIFVLALKKNHTYMYTKDIFASSLFFPNNTHTKA